ncbi:MAG: ROK family protein [Candidatus Dormibacteraeota bacterium]|nr:ROK family protein [Candidatus Dormibacteraeota bacterium]MBV9525155.1 ROK family protein [Candidatus Dormibacteraeota bacterium]
MIGLLDIGGTKLAAARSAEPGRLQNLQRTPTPADPAGALASLLDRAADGAELDAIAVSLPGPFDRAGAALIDPPGMPERWHGLRVGEDLGERYGCPVVVENDANAAALAEATWGAGRDAQTVVYFTVSTGVGTGVVRDGAVWHGRHDTEGGHQVVWPRWAGGPPCHCGGAGCLEALASGLAIERRFGVRGEHLEDPEAWADIGRWLGLGAVNAIALVDPDVVLFGGGVTAAWDRFAPSLQRTIAEHLHLQPVPRVELGSLGEERNLLGALALGAAALAAPVR